MTIAKLDLSQLALDRSPRGVSVGGKSRPRKWLTRYVLPAAILVGFLSLLAATAGTGLWPKRSVQVLPVIVKRSDISETGTPLFQAAGWVEPRPTSINVPALAAGVIEQLLVVEGQAVKKDQPIAQLISIDAEISAKQAEAALAKSEGELRRAVAGQRAAKVRLEKPVHLQVQLADANGTLAKTRTELAKLPFLIESAIARLEYSRQSVEGKKVARKAVAGIVLQKAESEFASADADLRELQVRKPNLQFEVDALQDKVVALQTQLELLVEETRQFEEADAKIDSSRASRDEAILRLQQAKLAVDRNTIYAPIDGRILRLVASPGMRVMGLEANAGQNSSTVVEMYDPARLQVRADVRLEDVPLVQIGQAVEIETALAEKMIRGRVLQTNSTANIQKNTLEVKVELLEPPPAIRPEMLVTATFLAPDTALTATTATTQSERIFIPKQLLQSAESGSFVWVVDADARAQRCGVATGKATEGELVEVTVGLSVTDKLISSNTDGLKPNSRVKVTGEDQTIGR